MSDGRKKNIDLAHEFRIGSEIIHVPAQEDIGNLRWRRKRVKISDILRGPDPLPDPKKVQVLYRHLKSIDRTALAFDIRRTDALKLLKSAGTDVKKEIARDWKKRPSLRTLADQHGPTTHTISRWIKSTGQEIGPRNSNKPIDEELVRSYCAEGRSTNWIAKEMGVSWKKVQTVIEKL